MSEHQEQGFNVIAARSGKPVRLAMQELWLTGTVLPVGARLVVRHCFQSREKKPLEAVYAFALPRDAAMRRFRIVGEGFNVESALKRSGEAREAYEAGLEEGHLAALAQQYQDGMVNLNIGNIRPGETVTVYIELAAGVSCTDAGFRFRFPFTLAPCYHPDAAYGTTDTGDGEVALPEAIFGDVILPPWRNDAAHLHRVGFDLSLELPGGGVEIASPSHAVSVRLQSPASARVMLATGGDVPNRDLVLDARHAVTDPRVFAGLDGSGKGRFAVLVPSTAFGPSPNGPKQVVFLIDHSGSMSGKPFAQAKQATLACIAALRPEDRFGVVFFESGVTRFPPGCVEAVQAQRDAARTFVNGMETAGGTELSAGIAAAVKLLPQGGDILLLTDGQVAETGSIIAKARKAGARVHCLGIGSASQDRFLALLARETGGTSHFATPRERVDTAALRLFNAIGAPAAEALRAEVTGLSGVSLVPEIPPCVRADEPLVVFGSCEAAGEGTLRLAWEAGSLDIPVKVTADMEAANDIPKPESAFTSLGETLRLVQGARLVTEAELPDKEASTRREAARHAKHRTARWERLAEEYGLANPGMSLVAVVERRGDQPGDVPVTRVVPVGMPQDTEFGAYFGGVSRRPLPGPGMPIMRCMSVPPVIREEIHACPAPSWNHMVEEEISDPVLDRLFEATAALEADGGLPGANLEERIVRTLAALIALLDYEGKPGGGYFVSHIRRMTDFLRTQGNDSVVPEHAALLQRALSAVDKNRVPAGEWDKAYSRLGHKADTDTLWKWLGALI